MPDTGKPPARTTVELTVQAKCVTCSTENTVSGRFYISGSRTPAGHRCVFGKFTCTDCGNDGTVARAATDDEIAELTK